MNFLYCLAMYDLPLNFVYTLRYTLYVDGQAAEYNENYSFLGCDTM